jgi:hypothetical protein
VTGAAGSSRSGSWTGATYNVQRNGYWLVDSRDWLDRIGPSVDDHFRCLLDRLDPHSAALGELIAQLDLRTEFWVYYSQRQWNSAWELSGDTLHRVASLRASIVCDAYTDGEDDDEDTEPDEEHPEDAPI